MASSMFSRYHNYTESLKELCIDCVVNNFDRFIHAYENCSVPVKYFEFLQRTLSKDLFQRLAERKALQNHHFAFLINSHLKELNLSYCDYDPEPILERLKVTGKSIKLLNLNQKLWSDKTLMDFVTVVPFVETLLLKSTECNDCILRTIGQQCKSVVKLDVSYCIYVTNEGIKDFLGKDENGVLGKNTVLQYLDLTSTNVTEPAVSIVLKQAPMLRTLQHDHVAEVIYEMHFTDFINGHTDSIPKYLLTSLHFYSLGSNNHYSSQTLANVVQVCSAFCPHITTLKIDGELDESVINACAKFQELKDVQLSNISYMSPSSHLHPFLESRGSRLLSFDLKNFFIPVKVFSDYCHRLHSLTLFAVEFNDNETLTSVDCFPHMREFGIQDANFAQKATAKSIIHLISNSPRLEILSLRYAHSLTTDIINMITRCKCILTLRCIDASYSDLNAAGALEIMTCASRLDRFLIEKVQISDYQYEELLQQSSLQHVNILWRAVSIYSSDDDDDELFGRYDFEDYIDDYMGYSDEYVNYDTDYSEDELYHSEL